MMQAACSGAERAGGWGSGELVPRGAGAASAECACNRCIKKAGSRTAAHSLRRGPVRPRGEGNKSRQSRLRHRPRT